MAKLGMGINLIHKLWNGVNTRLFLPILRKYRVKHYSQLESISLVTSNCIGGILSNAYGLKFKSPTVNLYMNALDYVSFVENLDENIHTSLIFCGTSQNGNYPIGRIGDITLHFVHYKNFKSANTKWIERANRANLSNVVLIMCERDGCTPGAVERFAKLPYSKILLAKNDYPYDFAFTVKPTRYEKRNDINPMDRLMEFGNFGKRRFEKYITSNVLINLVRKGK